MSNNMNEALRSHLKAKAHAKYKRRKTRDKKNAKLGKAGVRYQY